MAASYKKLNAELRHNNLVNSDGMALCKGLSEHNVEYVHDALCTAVAEHYEGGQVPAVVTRFLVNFALAQERNK